MIVGPIVGLVLLVVCVVVCVVCYKKKQNTPGVVFNPNIQVHPSHGQQSQPFGQQAPPYGQQPPPQGQQQPQPYPSQPPKAWKRGFKCTDCMAFFNLTFYIFSRNSFFNESYEWYDMFCFVTKCSNLFNATIKKMF